MSKVNWDDFTPAEPVAPAPAPKTAVVDWSQFEPVAPKGIIGHARDLGLAAARSAIAVPEIAVGAADLLSGGKAGKLLENQGGVIGFRPKQAKELLSDWETDQLKAQRQEFANADGVGAKFGVAMANPSLITNTVVESAAPMLAGGLVGRGVRALAPAISGATAAGIGEGAVMAGSAAEQIRQQTADGLLTGKQSALALGTGLVGAAVGAAGNKLGKAFGDADSLLVDGLGRTVAREGAEVATRSLPVRIAGSAAVEGAEELAQSVPEQVFQNAALSRPLDEGVADAAVMGTLAGVAMGAGAGIARGFGSRAAVTPPPGAQTPGTPPVTPGPQQAPPTGTAPAAPPAPTPVAPADPPPADLPPEAAPSASAPAPSQLEPALTTAEANIARTRAEWAAAEELRAKRLAAANVPASNPAAGDQANPLAPTDKPEWGVSSVRHEGYKSLADKITQAYYAGDIDLAQELADKLPNPQDEWDDRYYDAIRLASSVVGAVDHLRNLTVRGVSLLRWQNQTLNFPSTATKDSPVVRYENLKDAAVVERLRNQEMDARRAARLAAVGVAEAPPNSPLTAAAITAVDTGAHDAAIGVQQAQALPEQSQPQQRQATERTGLPASYPQAAQSPRAQAQQKSESAQTLGTSGLQAQPEFGDTPSDQPQYESAPVARASTQSSASQTVSPSSSPVEGPIIAPDQAGYKVQGVDEAIQRGANSITVSRDGQPVPFNTFVVSVEGNTAQVASVERASDSQGGVRGSGFAAYVALGNELAARGVTLTNGDRQNAPGAKLWTQLVQAGHARRRPSGRGFEFVARVAPQAQAPAPSPQDAIAELPADQIEAARAQYDPPTPAMRGTQPEPQPKGVPSEKASQAQPQQAQPEAAAAAVAQPTGEVAQAPRPATWRKNAIQAAAVARSVGITTKGMKPAEIVAAVERVDAARASGSTMLGQDNTPMAEGGQPFKTREQAAKAKKLQPTMRVASISGGFALIDKTPAQLAAEKNAARRLRTPKTSPAGEPIPAHAFIASMGGLRADTRKDMNIGDNPLIGNRRLFAGLGKGLPIERATARLIEEGYLSNGASHSDAMALIKRSLTSPQYTAEGYTRMAERDDEARRAAYMQQDEPQDAPQADPLDEYSMAYEDALDGPQPDFEDYLAAQQDYGDYLPDLDQNVALDLQSGDFEGTGFNEAEKALQAEVMALIEMADGMGIDAEAVRADAYDTNPDANLQEYYAASISLLEAAIGQKEAIARGGKNRRPDSGQQSGPAAAREGSAPEGVAGPAPEVRTVDESINPRVPGENRAPASSYGEGKQPWEMSSSEFSRQENGNPHWNQSYAGKDDGAYLSDTQKTHEKLVMQAVASGKLVPADVLADYSDINRPAKPTTPPNPNSVATKARAAKAKKLTLRESAAQSRVARESAARDAADHQAQEVQPAEPPTDDQSARRVWTQKEIGYVPAQPKGKPFQLVSQKEPYGIATPFGAKPKFGDFNQYFATPEDAAAWAEKNGYIYGENPYAKPKPAQPDTLTPPTPEQIIAQQARAEAAPQLDAKEQIDREAPLQTLTQPTAPEQRQDTSGDMFGVEKAQAEIDKRNAGQAAKTDPNQGWMFDEPADAVLQSGKIGEVTFPEPPVFETLGEVADWMEQRAKDLGMGRRQFTATYEYRNAYDQIEALASKTKAEQTRELQDKGRELLAKMTAAGVKVGDRVESSFAGPFLSSYAVTGTVYLNNNGIPTVKLDAGVPVTRSGGRPGLMTKTSWNSGFKVKRDSATAPPAEAAPATQAAAILDAANITGKERIDALKDVKKGDVTPEELEAAYPAVNPAPADDLNAMFDDIMAETAPAEPPTPAKPRTTPAKAPRTATQAAGSAAKNTAAALANAIDGLGALFGAKSKGRIGSGLSFDEDTYAQAKPLFIQAVSNLKDASADIREAMRAVISMVTAKFGRETTENMKPYIVRFASDVRDGTISQEELNAASTDGRVERDSAEPTTEPAVGDTVSPDARGAPAATDGAGGRASAEAGRGQQDGTGVPFGSAPVARERGDQPVSAGNPAPELASIIAGSDFSEPGGDSGLTGVPPEPIPASEVAAAADAGNAGLKAGIERARADKAPVKLADIESIRATLPQLLDGQQEDVLKAEQRFTKPDGYGMLFTNGTGTGKTFTGLGIVKRFARQGKTNTLIAVPDDKIAADWIESGKVLGLEISKLKDIKDAGRGIVITSYANMGANDALATRQWDAVVADEAHTLAQDKDGTPTTYLQNLRAITHHPDGAYQRYTMLHRAEIDEMARVSADLTDAVNRVRSPLTPAAEAAKYEAISDKLDIRINALKEKLDAARKAVSAEVDAKQGTSRARLVALSATPFAYEKTIDWANGYLFDYNEGQRQDGASGTGGRAYNSGSNRERFFMRHFGYSMRYNKLTAPDAKVDDGLMQRQFNTMLKKSGALSGRMLDVRPDYDRRFVLVDSAIGNRIDEALSWLSERRKGSNGFAKVADAINNQFKYLQKRYLLEAIKASEVIPIVRRHLAMGRKVVVFHDYKKGGGFNPFKVNATSEPGVSDAIAAFNAEFGDLVNSNLDDMPSPIAVFKRELPGTLFVNGDEKKADLLARYKQFQDDASGPQVMLVQSAKNKGWSGHDATGKHQRVLINLGQPTAPTLAIQQEGRIYRTGQASDAIMRYLNTGTNWERWTFATTIAGRASTAENLGMGESARALKDSFIQAFDESDTYAPGHEGEGKGGKERDKAANNALSEYDRAKTLYWANQKKTARTKAQEGVDYFATPEPVGLKMVQWLDARSGEDLMEPSGGHGAIARWLPERSNKTVIEPSTELRSRLALVMNAMEDRIIAGTFEDHAVQNKYDGIAMNPPFGTAGRMAVDHIAKAAQHLRDGGRIVAILPTGPSADAKFEKWLYGKVERPAKPLQTRTGMEKVYAGDTISFSDNAGKHVFIAAATGRNRYSTASSDYVTNADESLKAQHGSYIVSPGPRVELFRPGEDLNLIANIQLPALTFERAGTGVMTRVVVIEKQTDKSLSQKDRARNIDLTNTENIAELFDRLEDLSLPPRPKTEPAKAVETKAPAKAEKPTRVDKPMAELGATVTLDGKPYKVTTYTTNAGKVLRGVWVPTKPMAERFGSTFKKPGEGWFVRESNFPAGSALDDRPAFSRAATKANAATQAAVDTITANWPNAPEIIVAHDMQDPVVPADVRAKDRQKRSMGAGKVEGFYSSGKVYLMSSALKTPDDVLRVLAHEVLGHAGLRGMFGDSLGGILNQVATMRRAEVEAKARAYKLDLADPAQRLQAAEEVLAEMAQTRPELGFVKRTITAIRNWLRANVPGFKSLELTDADIIQAYLLPARGWVERGRAAGVGGSAAFSRGAASQTDTPAFKKWFGESKVVDAKGKPMVVYHGTSADINEFQGDRFYFTADPEYASRYAREGDGSNVMPVYLSLQNPLDLSSLGDGRLSKQSVLNAMAANGVRVDGLRDVRVSKDGQDIGIWAWWHSASVIEAVRNAGYDSAIQYEKTSVGRTKAYIAFNPEEVKSAIGNSGDFNPANPDIRFSRSPTDIIGAGIDRARDAANAMAGRNDARAADMPDLDADQRALLGKIGASRTPTADAIKAATDRAGVKIRQGLVDRYASLKELDERALGANFLDTAITDSSWVLAKMSSAAGGALNSMMTVGRIRYNAGQKVIELQGEPDGGLTAALKKLGPPAEVERFFAWVAANRSHAIVERNKAAIAKTAEAKAELKNIIEMQAMPGKTAQQVSQLADARKEWEKIIAREAPMLGVTERLFTLEEIAAGMALNTNNTEAGQPRAMLYAQAFADFQKYRDDVLAIAEAAGIISEENRAMWRDEFYVPFYRIMDEDAKTGGPVGGGGLSRQEAFKRLKGGKQNLNDLMENTLMNFHHLLSASLKNQAAAQAVKNAERAGLAHKVPESRRDTKTSTFVLEGGKKTFYQVDDALVFESITTLSDPGLNNTAVRVMSTFKRVFTQLTTVTPQFVIANTFRDLLQASATSPTSKNIGKNLAQGIKSYRDEKTRAEMLASGGAFSFGHIYGMDAEEVKASLRKTVAGAELISHPSMIPGILRKGWAAWDNVINTSENISRAATYVQNVEQLGKLRAAFEARDVMDFSQHGAWPAIRFMIRVVPFLNARLQGLDKLYRSGLKPSILTAMGKGSDSDKQSAARFATVTGALTVATMALFLANSDDDEYQKLEEWQKDTYWFFRIGGNAFFLPKPFEVGAIATLAERILQQAIDDKATGRLFAERLKEMLMQTFAFNPVPQMFQPALDVYSNKDAFTKRDIESVGMERMSPGLRARDTTTAPARAISAAALVFGDKGPLAISPVQADHLIKGYLGGVGASAAGILDTMYRGATSQESPDKRFVEYQPIRRFYRDLETPVANTRYSTLFYDGLREANRVYADVRELQKLGRPEDAGDLSNKKRSVLQMRVELNAQQRRLTDISNRLKEVNRSDKDGAWKRREVDLLNTQRALITERMGKMIEAERAAR